MNLHSFSINHGSINGQKRSNSSYWELWRDWYTVSHITFVHSSGNNSFTIRKLCCPRWSMYQMRRKFSRKVQMSSCTDRRYCTLMGLRNIRAADWLRLVCGWRLPPSTLPVKNSANSLICYTEAFPSSQNIFKLSIKEHFTSGTLAASCSASSTIRYSRYSPSS